MYPTFIEFELTNNCQLSCIMCPHRLMKRSKGFMKFSLLKKVVDEVKGHTIDSYLHMQGEPLLHPQLIQCINYVADAGIRTSFATNCLLLDEVMTDKLLNSKLNEIILSIDSLDKKCYEGIRVGSNFETVINNIRYFLDEKNKRNSKLSAVVCFTKMIENSPEHSTFTIPGADQVWTKGYSTFAGHVTKGETVKSMKEGCTKQHTHMTIHWNGDAVKCCRDFDGVTKYGNVLKQSVKDVWANNTEKDCRNIPFCANC